MNHHQTIQNRNAELLNREFKWFSAVLEKRIQDYFNPEHPEQLPETPPPVVEDSESWYGTFVRRHQFSPQERVVVLLALAPEIRPHLLDIFFTKNKLFDRGFTEFGGIIGNRHSGFIPTLQTAIFILAGENLAASLSAVSLFERDHAFRKQGILDLDMSTRDEPFTCSTLRLSRDSFSFITKGRGAEPEYSIDFPAKRMETLLAWEDLVLSPHTLEQLQELKAWLIHGEELLNTWNLEKHVRPGYRALFFGPPGTGKTLTASLLGKLAARSVFRIDLSQIVSKYIGETEKNLERIFQQAEQKNWILFFDEADALFGKRTQISDAHDRYANQGTSYLLQRLEDCPNVVILASNLRSNLDEAFTRRFQSAIYFPMPEKRERFKLWTSTLSPIADLETSIDLDKVAEKYELAGGAIVNVIRYCTLMAIKRQSRIIANHDLMAGIQREYSKEGRTV